MRSFFGAIEDWNTPPLQDDGPSTDCDRSSGRSRIGTHPRSRTTAPLQIAIVLRGDRGLEPAAAPIIGAGAIAIVLRGDRGLERSRQRQSELKRGIAIVLRGDRGLEPRLNGDRW